MEQKPTHDASKECERTSIPESETNLDETVDPQLAKTFLPGDAAKFSDEGTEMSLTQLGKWQLIRRLGAGGMGEVFEAQHSETKERVALKLLPARAGAQLLEYFKREFRSLSEIHHANLVSMLSLECEGHQWFITMDLIDGVDFLTYVRPEGRLSEQRLREKLRELAQAVAALHSHNIVHRDLKPDNVLVDRNGRLVLVDFGLVVELDRTEVSKRGGEIQGTAAYMSPQQVQGEISTPACDWYAVGTMLYQALSGRLPFRGKTVEVLMQKTSQAAPALELQECPDLQQLAMQLLSRVPEERVPARDALIGMSALTALDNTSPGEELIGRGQQLQQLNEIFHSCRAEPTCQFALVMGMSGEGKSSLVEAFLSGIRDDTDVTILPGRCYDRESVPFKALDSIVDGISVYLRHLDPVRTAILLPDDVAFIAHLFPVLKRVKVIEESIGTNNPAEKLDAGQVRLRAFRALRLLFTRLSRGGKTIVIYIDDLQWGDSDSAKGLFEILKPPFEASILLIGTCRSDEHRQSSFLKQYESLSQSIRAIKPRQIDVFRLNLDQSRQLIEEYSSFDMSQQNVVVDRIIEESGGNPLLMVQILESLERRGDDLTFPSLNDVINRKLKRLPNLADRLLCLLAVWGRTWPLNELAGLAGHQATTVSTLTKMRSEKLIRWVTDDDDTVVDVYHDKIRENTLANLSGPEKKDLHRTLALALEAKTTLPDDQQIASLQPAGTSARALLFDLSIHFDGADVKDKACYYGFLAAEYAKSLLAMEVAEEHYAIASRNAQRFPGPSRYRIHTGLAQVEAGLGRTDAAYQQLNDAAEFAADDLDLVRLQTIRLGLLMKQRRTEESLTLCRQALQTLGIQVPRSSLSATIGSIRELVSFCLPARRTSKMSDLVRKQLRLRLINQLSYLGRRQKLLFPWSHLKGRNLAKRLPENAQTVTAKIVAVYAMNVLRLSTDSGASKCFEEAITYCRRTNDRLQEAHTWMLNAVHWFYMVRTDESLNALEHAEQIFTDIGAAHELIVTRAIRANLLIDECALADSIHFSREAFEMAVALGRRDVMPGFLEPWARAADGNIPLEEIESRLGVPLSFDPERNLIRAMWLKRRGEYQEAVRLLEENKQFFRICSPFLTRTSSSTYPILVSVLREYSESVQQSDPILSRSLLKQAIRHVRHAILRRHFMLRQIPMLYRESALLLQRRGQLRKALKDARRSCRAAEDGKMHYELIQSQIVLERILQQSGDANWEVAKAEEELARITTEATAAAVESHARENPNSKNAMDQQ